MRIDRSHRSWLVFSLLLLAAGTGAYVYYVRAGGGRLNGPSGGSWPGLAFGSVGTAFILFALLLGVRKRVRTWRVGRAEFWMRGHLWLGTLALPFIWFHGGFRMGGALTSWAMALLYITVISGWIGAVIQHFLPKRMTALVGQETIYEQIPQVMRHL